MMNKVKSPMVKVLRKAGYSVKDAINITMDAQFNYQNQRADSMQNFNQLAIVGGVIGMFSFIESPEGYNFWADVAERIALNK